MARAAYDEAMTILTKYRKEMDTMAELLLERETITGRDVKEIVAHGRIFSEVERAEQDGVTVADSQDGTTAPKSESTLESESETAPESESEPSKEKSGASITPPLTPPDPSAA